MPSSLYFCVMQVVHLALTEAARLQLSMLTDVSSQIV